MRPSPLQSAADVARDLLAGCAILDGEGLTTGFGHLSARSGEDEIRISSSVGPGLVSAPEDLLTLSAAGEVLAGDPALLPGEAAIHVGILGARDDVSSVCRFHGPACMAWSTLGRPLPATTGMGLFLGHEVPWFDTSTTVTTAEHADRLANQLGGEKAVLMRGFGAVTVGTSVAEAVARAWLLERAAATVVTAAAIATPLAFPASAAAPFESRDGPATAQLHRTWNYLRHKWTSAATTTTEILRT